MRRLAVSSCGPQEEDDDNASVQKPSTASGGLGSLDARLFVQVAFLEKTLMVFEWFKWAVESR